MADIVPPDVRSRMMAAIKSKDTRPEVTVRSFLHRSGFRFRKNVEDMPGKPDIVLPKYRTVIFVHGCFWHRHQGCKYATTPKSRKEFWDRKFDANVKRDIAVREQLLTNGWRVIVVWECQIEEKWLRELVQKIRQGEDDDSGVR